MHRVTPVVIVTVVSLIIIIIIIVQLDFALHDIPQVFSFPNNIECVGRKKYTNCSVANWLLTNKQQNIPVPLCQTVQESCEL